MNVYQECPVLESKRFLLSFVKKEDCRDLLKVYSDPQAAPLFNSDNCHGDDFHYQTEEQMMQAIEFWLFSYYSRYFVRWSIIDKTVREAVGTVELFQRDALDGNGHTALLRLDLRSDYEQPVILEELLRLLHKPACELFESGSVTTKAAAVAEVRRKALCKCGYQESTHLLTGHDGTRYGDYFVCSTCA